MRYGSKALCFLLLCAWHRAGGLVIPAGQTPTPAVRSHGTCAQRAHIPVADEDEGVSRRAAALAGLGILCAVACPGRALAAAEDLKADAEVDAVRSLSPRSPVGAQAAEVRLINR